MLLLLLLLLQVWVCTHVYPRRCERAVLTSHEGRNVMSASIQRSMFVRLDFRQTKPW
jgi:hypothetical protein